jgi:hypothetical protein
MKRLKIVLFFLLFSIGTTYAQQHELGLSIGGANYIGDIGRETYFYPNKLSGGIFYTSVINPWFSGRMNLNYISLYANDLESESQGRRLRKLSFSGSSLDLSLGIEYKFFPRNPYIRQKGARRFSPYMFSGLLVAQYSGQIRMSNGNDINYNGATLGIPMMLGVKYKIAENFLISVETGASYYFSDNLDGTYHVYANAGINKGTLIPSTNTNSNDWHTFTSISFIYTFGDLRCYFGF